MRQPMQQQVDPKKKEELENKAENVVKALKGIAVADVGMVFQIAQQKILKESRV